MLTEADVRTLLDTDEPVRPMFHNDEFDVWAVGDDLVAKFPRSEIDAAKIGSELALHPTLKRLLGDVVPPIRMARSASDGDPFIVHDRAPGLQGQTGEGVTIAPSAGLAEHIGSLFADAARGGWRPRARARSR